MSSLYILTPCRNASATLPYTLDSILSQTGNFQLYYHVQDGNSTDETRHILVNYEKKIASNPVRYGHIHFSWVSEKDGGMYDAIQKAVDYLSIPPSALMGWINADDTFCDGAFTNILDATTRFPDLHWCGGIPLVIDEQGNECHGRSDFTYPQELLSAGACDGVHWRNIQQEGTFWRKWLWDAAGGIDVNFRFAGDWDLWRRMAKHAPYIQLSFFTAAFHRSKTQLSNGPNYNNEINAALSLESRRLALKKYTKDLHKKMIKTCYLDEGLLKFEYKKLSLSKKDKISIFIASHGLYKMLKICHKLNALIKKIR